MHINKSEEIRLLRKSIGVSQMQLALEAGMSNVHLCQIEKGKKMLTVAIRDRILVALERLKKDEKVPEPPPRIRAPKKEVNYYQPLVGRPSINRFDNLRFL